MSHDTPLTTMLMQEYGLVVNAGQTARLLGFRNAAALAKARQRGQLGLVMFQLPHRRGWFAEIRAIEAWLSSATCLTPPAPAIANNDAHPGGLHEDT